MKPQCWANIRWPIGGWPKARTMVRAITEPLPMTTWVDTMALTPMWCLDSRASVRFPARTTQRCRLATLWLQTVLCGKLSSRGANVNFAMPSGGNAELSVEAWVSVTNTTQTTGAGIVTKGYGNGGEQFDLDNNAGFRFLVRDASGAVHVAASAVTPVVKNWYHLVGVWDGAGGTASLYVNGVTNVVASGVPAGVGLLTATTTNTALPGAALVSIGARTSSQSVTNYDLQFKGRIEDVAIYNYALTPTQVFADFNTGVEGAVVVPSLAALTGTNYLTLAW